LFADEKIETGRWLFNAGMRADYFHFAYDDLLNNPLPGQQKIIISPKINVQYSFANNLQFYFKTGKGFHSNDTRVVIPQQAKNILPASFGSDLGLIWKPVPSLLVDASMWHLYLEQEFVYVGDEGIVEPGGRTKRLGADVSVHWQVTKNLFADININSARARNIDEAKDENYIPLVPAFTSTGGIAYQNDKGWKTGLRYRYIKDRPANENNSIIAEGYFLTDASLSYTTQQMEIGAIVENIFNTKWNEAQFATTSRLKDEQIPVTELHFTPGSPLFFKLRLAFFF
jgi:outer membrane receptor protein involved in Fe transport